MDEFPDGLQAWHGVDGVVMYCFDRWFYCNPAGEWSSWGVGKPPPNAKPINHPTLGQMFYSLLDYVGTL